MALANPVQDMQLLMSSSTTNKMIARRAFNTIMRKYGSLDKFAHEYGDITDTHPDEVLQRIGLAFKQGVKRQKLDYGGMAGDAYGDYFNAYNNQPDSSYAGQTPTVTAANGFPTGGGDNSSGMSVGDTSYGAGENSSLSADQKRRMAQALMNAGKDLGKGVPPPAFVRTHFAGVDDYRVMREGGRVHMETAGPVPSNDQKSYDPNDPQQQQPILNKNNWGLYLANIGGGMLASGQHNLGNMIGAGLEQGNSALQKNMDYNQRQQEINQTGALNKARIHDYEGQAQTRTMAAQQSLQLLVNRRQNAINNPEDAALYGWTVDALTQQINQARASMGLPPETPRAAATPTSAPPQATPARDTHPDVAQEPRASEQSFASETAALERSGPNAVSPKGAQGDMQVMPGTAAAPGYGVTPARGSGADEISRVGVDYGNMLDQRYDGDRVLGHAAYNAGPARVDTWIKQFGDPRKGEISDTAFAAKIPFAETRDYVGRYLATSAPKLANSTGQVAGPGAPSQAPQGALQGPQTTSPPSQQGAINATQGAAPTTAPTAAPAVAAPPSATPPVRVATDDMMKRLRAQVYFASQDPTTKPMAEALSQALTPKDGIVTLPWKLGPYEAGSYKVQGFGEAKAANEAPIEQQKWTIQHQGENTVIKTTQMDENNNPVAEVGYQVPTLQMPTFNKLVAPVASGGGGMTPEAAAQKLGATPFTTATPYGTTKATKTFENTNTLAPESQQTTTTAGVTTVNPKGRTITDALKGNAPSTTEGQARGDVKLPEGITEDDPNASAYSFGAPVPPLGASSSPLPTPPKAKTIIGEPKYANQGEVNAFRDKTLPELAKESAVAKNGLAQLDTMEDKLHSSAPGSAHDFMQAAGELAIAAGFSEESVKKAIGLSVGESQLVGKDLAQMAITKLRTLEGGGRPMAAQFQERFAKLGSPGMGMTENGLISVLEQVRGDLEHTVDVNKVVPYFKKLNINNGENLTDNEFQNFVNEHYSKDAYEKRSMQRADDLIAKNTPVKRAPDTTPPTGSSLQLPEGAKAPNGWNYAGKAPDGKLLFADPNDPKHIIKEK